MSTKRIWMRSVAVLAVSLVLWPCVGLAADSANSLPGSEELLASVRLVVDEPEASVDWLTVARAVTRLGELGESQAAAPLIEILRREAPLRLTDGTPLPGVMSPLDILKAASIDALVKLDADESVPEIERLARTAGSDVLRQQANEALSAFR